MTVQELIAAIRARLPAATVSCNLREGLWRAAAVATPNINLERKGSTKEEAYTRLLDSVIQVQATQQRGSWRRHG